jgi:hypothetical protein
MAAPPAPPPQPSPPGAPREPRAPAKGTFALGFSGAGLSGSVSDNYGATSNWFGDFFQVDLEGGFRPNPSWTLLLQLNLGGGDVGGPLRDYCKLQGLDSCVSSTARIGVAARYAFTPRARNTPWVSVGLGREATGVVLKGPAGTSTLTFAGWEWLKLAAGWDLRLSHWFGLGAFVGYSLGTYGSVSGDGPYLVATDLGAGKTHGWWMLGVRTVLFP